MRTAIRKHLRDFLAIVVLVLLAAVVGGYILAHQRIYLPGWVPVFGRSYYTLKGEFSTAQAITPGQGQTVDIAGVQVGEISNVDLVDGRAIVTMRIKPKYDEVYPNATMLLRPKTGLKDMIVELDPGTSAGGKRLKSGATIPVSQTQPDVNLDEILSSLDVDTRNYLQLLLNGAATGLDGQGRDLAQVFRRFDPTAQDIKQITRLVAQRRTNVRRVIHNFGLITNELGDRDTRLRDFVSSSNAVFRRFADQTDNLQKTIDLLPGALQQTQTALVRTKRFADQLGPTLEALRPTARALGPALEATRPFLQQSTPVIENQIAPFTTTATPVVKSLRGASSDLAAAAKPLSTAFGSLNDLFNLLAYNPPGKQEGYLFYVAWLNHLLNSNLTGQDALGPVRRTVVALACTGSSGINGLRNLDRQGSAAIALIAQLSLFPTLNRSEPGFCPTNILPDAAATPSPGTTTTPTTSTTPASAASVAATRTTTPTRAP
jgi:phospholipid/cholesterol/gamma-HCH transport system substrate-binding protein